MEQLDFVKWWGAIIATIALGWNIYNTLTNAPKIKIRYRLNTSYPDGRVISTEILENGESKKLAEYCHIEISNIGRASSTITNIEMTHKDRRMFTSSQCFLPHSEKRIPFLLAPGEVWSCRLEMDLFNNISNHGKPEIHVAVSYKDKPLVVRPKQ